MKKYEFALFGLKLYQKESFFSKYSFSVWNLFIIIINQFYYSPDENLLQSEIVEKHKNSFDKKPIFFCFWELLKKKKKP